MDENEVRVMIAYKKEGKKSADRFAEIYKKLFKVEYADDIMRFEEALKEAERSDMTHMLYFTDDVNLILSSLADELGGYSLEISVDDLQKVLSQNAHDML